MAHVGGGRHGAPSNETFDADRVHAQPQSRLIHSSAVAQLSELSERILARGRPSSRCPCGRSEIGSHTRRAPDKAENRARHHELCVRCEKHNFSQGLPTGRNRVDCSLFVLAWRLWLRNRLRARTGEPMRAYFLQAAPSVPPFEQPDEARLALRRAVQATLAGLAEMDCLLDRAEQLLARRGFNSSARCSRSR